MFNLMGLWMSKGGRKMTSDCVECEHGACGACEIATSHEGGLTWICCICQKENTHIYSDNE